MACYLNENVYTHTFTPKEYQVELLDSAKKRNTIVCSSTSSSKAFIVVKLLQEFSWQMRNVPGKRALFILDLQNVPIMTCHVKYLTDLNVISITKSLEEVERIKQYLENYQVIITTAEISVEMLSCESVIEDLAYFNLLVIDDCLYGQRQTFIKLIMKKYRDLSKEKPRILGLTTGLLGLELQPDRLEAELRRLEKLLNCSVDTSSEIVTLIRLSCRPRESIIDCPKNQELELQLQIKSIINHAKLFLLEHRYDPSEIYDDDLLEELKEVPNPKDTPLQLLNDFLEILEDLGPWGADKAALHILSKIEKLKVKVPYERHYLLLCLISSTLVTIRAACDYEFEKLDDFERLKKYSTPKVLKFIEILKQFKPPGKKPEPVEKAIESDISINTRGKGKTSRRSFISRPQTEEILCALVFVHNRYKAKALFALLCVCNFVVYI